MFSVRVRCCAFQAAAVRSSGAIAIALLVSAQLMAQSGTPNYRSANAPVPANPFRQAKQLQIAHPNDPDLYGGVVQTGFDDGSYISDYGGDSYCGCESYGCDTCGTCDRCGCGSRCWFGVEYLGWTLDGNNLPPLVTASSSAVPLVDAAQLDQPGVVILSGNDTVNDSWRSGVRFSAGAWLDECQRCGVTGDYFRLGDDDYDFLSGQSGALIVGRPFFNTQTGLDDAELVSVPNELDGTARVQASDDFWGAGVSMMHTLCCCSDPCSCDYSRVNCLVGYRHYAYDSALSINEDLTVLPGTTTPLVPGTTILVSDNFRTKNEFDGAELGLQGRKNRRGLWLDGLARVALGRNRRTAYIDGQTVATVPGGGTTTSAGGLLTSSVTNIGTYHDTEFAVIPEFRVGLGANINRNISVWVGYNVIVWANVSRASETLPPGLQVDPRNLPPVQPGGGDDPAFPGLGGSQLLAHGIDVGVMWQW